MPDVELGINDMWRQGKEVVGRHDIIPVVTEEWIRLENVEFHTCVQQDEYERSRIIKYVPRRSRDNVIDNAAALCDPDTIALNA